jgi:hypothetical protein
VLPVPEPVPGRAGAQAVGLVGGPAFALLFSGVNVALGNGFYLDKYTAPGYVSALLGAINLVLILTLFVEAPRTGGTGGLRRVCVCMHITCASVCWCMCVYTWTC